MPYDNNNSGALFRNDKKKEDKEPDYKGSINVEGKEFWVNGWINEAKESGKKYLKVKVSPKENSGGDGRDNPRQRSQRSRGTDDDFPC